MQFAPRRKWNLLIKSSNKDGFFLESLDLYSSLLKSGCHGDHLTFTFVVKACAQLASLWSGRKVQSHVILLGFQSDVFVQTSLLDMYSKCSSLSEARQLFDEMPSKSVVSWNSMISAYAKEFQTQESFRHFNEMRSCCFRPTSSTCVSLVSGCSGSTSALQQGQSVHCFGTKLGFHSDLRLWNSILTMYVRFNLIDDAISLFDSMKERSAITYTTIFGGYAKLGDCLMVLNLFNQIRLKQIGLDAIVFVNLISSCALLGRLLIASSVLSLLIRNGLDCEPNVAAAVVNMFAKCGDIFSARKFFDSVTKKDVLLWTSMIGGYVHADLSRTALDLFEDMISTDLPPNKITIITILSACAAIGSLSAAEQIFEHIDAYGFKSDLQTQTSLIHMYCKCGCLERAEEIFNALSHKDLAAWSSMINCYAFNGKGEESLALFKEMLKDKSIKPDAVVFTDVLSACNHYGLVEEGLKFFTSMQLQYGIEPSKEHYSCMVDLLSRAGYIDSSLEFISRVPVQLRSQLWTPFLSALRTSNGAQLENILPNRWEVESESTGNHVLLAGISASLGKWKDARDFRMSIDKRGLRKEAGWSRTELYS
ncbi:hypothetical protein IEQ34_019442 [Dendrobium chrysotoxum]|uniref:Pentatricopeptide repeat-containing protein n=1 Tax=Dendrobium chrysotoxum TaxID=161865 RepID=A0AAV7G8N2_DENCH|nr:hypothetical protein IEQ34_019442 [Dendrobium chrysotoxum]